MKAHRQNTRGRDPRLDAVLTFVDDRSGGGGARAAWDEGEVRGRVLLSVSGRFLSVSGAASFVFCVCCSRSRLAPGRCTMRFWQRERARRVAALLALRFETGWLVRLRRNPHTGIKVVGLLVGARDLAPPPARICVCVTLYAQHGASMHVHDCCRWEVLKRTCWQMRGRRQQGLLRCVLPSAIFSVCTVGLLT